MGIKVSPKEFAQLVCSIQGLEGALLKSAKLQNGFYQLEWLKQGASLWLWVDLTPNSPLVFVDVVGLSYEKSKAVSPMLLFLRAHFIGRRLINVRHERDQGRIVKLSFTDEDHDAESCVLELRLFPGGANLLARAGAKLMSVHPVREVPPLEDASGQLVVGAVAMGAVAMNEAAVRSCSEIIQQWAKSLRKPIQRNTQEKQAKKLEVAIAKVKAELSRKQNLPYRLVGEWLKTHQSLEVPKEFDPFVDHRRRLAWNIERMFHLAKESERKMEGTLLRLRELEKQRAELDRSPWPQPPKTQVDLLSRAQAGSLRTRRLNLSEQIFMLCGRSSRDNAELLRRARPWDLWFHLRDSPSSHGVVFRERYQVLSREDEVRAAQFLIQVTFGAKARAHDGEKFELLVAECRHVKPMKGAGLGRVTYRNEKSFVVSFSWGASNI